MTAPFIRDHPSSDLPAMPNDQRPTNQPELSSLEKEQGSAIDAIRWYPLRAYKAEFKTEKAIQSYPGISFFVAKRYVKTTRHGKPVRILTPSIPSLVFVKASLRQINILKENLPYLQYLWFWDSEIGQKRRIHVPEDQMQNFMKVASQTESEITYYTADELDLAAGKKVRIHGGVMDGCTGVLLRPHGKRSRQFIVQVDKLGCAAISVPLELIEII